MRVVAALMKHETNTFSPVATPLQRFAVGGPVPYLGRAAYDAYKGTGSALAAYIDLAEAEGADLVTPIAANAPPSGRVDQEAFEYIADAICREVAKGCDAILLDLHGAMATEKFEDGEGELLTRVRRLAPKTPIAVAYDMHGNLFPAMVDTATVVSGYQTYPHVDHYNTGMRAGRTLFRSLKGEVKPTMAWGNVPMLPHIMRQGTGASPNREIQARARQMEANGEALVATVLTGFPHADVTNAGLSAIVVTDGDMAAAQRLRDELLGMAWSAREAFVYRIEPLEKSLERARALADKPGEGPVVLLDHFDNCASGGTMDTTKVLGAILRSPLEDVAAFAIYDPAAVKKLAEAGQGAEVTLPIGGNADMPSINKRGEPLSVTGRVKRLGDGKYRNLGPMESGVMADMGACALLDTGKVEIALVSRHVEPYDIGPLNHLGIDPMKKRYLMLKSRVHFRATYEAIAKEIVDCAGVGVCTSDYGELTFEHVRRPIYPLDPGVTR